MDDDTAALRAEIARLRDELDRSRALHVAAIESLPFDFWARDRDGVCVSENSECRRNWGTLLGTRPEDTAVSEEVLAQWLDNNRRALGGEVVRGNVDYVRAGETVHIHNILAPIHRGDEIVGTLGVNIDLTELRRLERRLRENQRLETVGLLAGGVAHDINNIVMIILGMTSLARRRASADAQLDADLSTIETASRRAAAICSQLLAFAGKGELSLELLDLGAVVGETAKLVRSTLPDDVELEMVRWAGAEPCAVEIDPTQLRQLVMNLMLNASEALEGKPGRITIALAPAPPETAVELGLDAARPHAMLSIADTGCGMTPDTRERIFEPFFTTKTRGRGLGLAAALGTVRAHGGAVGVTSAPGQGSTFRVLLPRADRAIASPAPAVTHSDWHGSGTVLIVDDHAGVADTTARMVGTLGFEPLVARGGAEALAVLAARPGIALVLLDLMMPGLDGGAVLERIREAHPALPVIVMSGFHDLAERPAAAPFLRKPFDLPELTEVVRGVTIRAGGLPRARRP